jgi:hypothetical protein
MFALIIGEVKTLYCLYGFRLRLQMNLTPRARVKYVITTVNICQHGLTINNYILRFLICSKNRFSGYWKKNRFNKKTRTKQENRSTAQA